MSHYIYDKVVHPHPFALASPLHLADLATPSHHGIMVMGDACVLAGGQAAAAASTKTGRRPPESVVAAFHVGTSDLTV